MNTFIISYDVTQDSSSSSVYPRIEQVIQSYGTWAHITQSCWAVKTNKDAVNVRDALLAVMRENDRLLVVQSSNIAAWHNALCRNDWLKENI